MTEKQSSSVAADGRAWPDLGKAIGLGFMMPIFEDPETHTAPSFEEMVDVALKAREAGFDSIWIADHFFGGDGSEEHPYIGIWECFTLMAGLASRVPDVQIGSLVACTGFRNPGVVAKMSAMIDEISGGRLILGLGAGWHKPEYDQFGYPFDHRVSRFEEAMHIIGPLVRTGKADYQGEFFQANDALNIPPGPREHGAPILIAGFGPRMLELVAQHADAWNTAWHRDTSKVRAQLEALQTACETVGRDPQTLVKTAGLYYDEASLADEAGMQAAADLVNQFRDLGFAHAICQSFPVTDEKLEAFGKVIAMVRAAELP